MRIGFRAVNRNFQEDARQSIRVHRLIRLENLVHSYPVKQASSAEKDGN